MVLGSQSHPKTSESLEPYEALKLLEGSLPIPRSLAALALEVSKYSKTDIVPIVNRIRGSKYPIFEDSGPKNHVGYGVWN